jgi:hypothetical protein
MDHMAMGAILRGVWLRQPEEEIEKIESGSRKSCAQTKEKRVLNGYGDQRASRRT